MNVEMNEINRMQSDMNSMREEVSLLVKQVEKLDEKNGEIYDALMGNKLTQSGGIIKRLVDMEIEQAKLQKQLKDIEEKHKTDMVEMKEKAVKSDLYVRILWGAAGFILAGIFTAILQYIVRSAH